MWQKEHVNYTTRVFECETHLICKTGAYQNARLNLCIISVSCFPRFSKHVGVNLKFCGKYMKRNFHYNEKNKVEEMLSLYFETRY